HGKLIRIEDENTGEEVPLLDDGPILAAADRLLKISERRSKMLGLDKPVQAEVTHKAEAVDSELLDVLKKVQERARAEADAVVEAEVVEGAPPAIEGGSDVVEDRCPCLEVRFQGHRGPCLRLRFPTGGARAQERPGPDAAGEPDHVPEPRVPLGSPVLRRD